jgi:signal transduction histidine kinase
LATFTVDTKLFEELGELLVAKESTALVELIKNAYDADATHVTVHGVGLKNAQDGRIVVSDDGSGMTEEEFRRGFLRIASRAKHTLDRRSTVFSRRFTGEKGIGRLAAHKLATKVIVKSRKAGPTPRGAAELNSALSGIVATINWATIEGLETLDQIEGSGAVTLTARRPKGWSKRRPGAPPPTFSPGTTLTLSPLRRPWSQRMVDAFLNEAVTLAPAGPLWERLPVGLVAEPLIFEQLAIRDQQASDPGFRVTFSGELAVPDVVTPDVAAAASWVAEVEYDRDSGRLEVAIAPTKVGLRKAPASEGYRFSQTLAPNAGPSFQARVFQRSNGLWPAPVQGIRVFMEGFRVSPYGDATDDWLGLERTYKSRAARELISLSKLDQTDLPAGLETEELVVQGNAAYMGAVFLHRSTSPELDMLVNREGFLPGAGLDFVAQWLRVTTDLIVRLGYAARSEVTEVRDEERVRQRQAAKDADVGETPSARRMRESAQAVERGLERVQAAIKAGKYEEAAEEVRVVTPHLGDVSRLSDEFGTEAVRWRVLASLGTELAAFVHEIRAMAASASEIVDHLDEALSADDRAATRSRIQRARKAALELAERIRRNATYLVDSTSFAGRRRRARLPLRERLEATVPFFATRLEQRRITFSNEVSGDLATPPMLPSELTGIFVNLLSNAVKFAGNDGRILVHAEQDNGMLRVTLENTGAPVEVARSAKFFEAFQSTTDQPDALLGQGMGMGLTITRAFVQEYGGTIRFTEPRRGYATAVQFELPSR